MTQLSDRAKLRLRLAAGLLRGAGVKFDCPRDQFYPAIQTHLNSMDVSAKERLREQVDWLEDYSNALPE